MRHLAFTLSITDIAVVSVIIILLVIFLHWLELRDPGEFQEPSDDAKFAPEPPILVECDTAGKPTPPEEVMVHVYTWTPSGCYGHHVVPLSQYLHEEADEPTTWQHDQVFPGDTPSSNPLN